MMAMNVEIENMVEREARVMRDGALMVGMGAVALGSEISPILLLLGAATIAVSIPFEAIRRFVHDDTDPVDISE